jgi:uncharacterized membrane protein
MRRRAPQQGIGWMSMAAGVGFGIAAVYAVSAQRARAKRTYATGQPDPYQTESITINQPIERVYEAWRNLESIAFMRGVELTESREQEMCGWRANDGTVGAVLFRRAPGARGTEVYVELRNRPGIVTSGIARVLGLAPDQQIREDLRRFKQLLETGEIVMSDGPGLWRPAQPVSSTDQLTAFSGV